MQTYATKKYLILIKRAKKQQVKENKQLIQMMSEQKVD